MAQRNSLQDQDGTIWNTVGLPLGTNGLDLRQPSKPEALTRLVNARFVDDRLLAQRDGHRGVNIRDGSSLIALGDSYAVSDEWVYGHGRRISSTAAAGYENAHHPFPRRGQATFNYDGTDIVLTGDRLLMVREEGEALGQSTYWQRAISTTALDYGIPAFLPLQTDSTPPAKVSGSYVETCLTPTLRVVVHTDTPALRVWLINRETGTIIHTSDISGASNNPVEPKVFESAGRPIVVWRDATDRRLYLTHWNGTTWSTAGAIVPEDVFAFDVAVVPGGFHLVWRTGAPSSVTLCVGRYAGFTKQNAPYVFGTALNISGITPTGPCAIGVSPGGDVGILTEVTVSGLRAQVFNSALSSISGGWTSIMSGTTWTGGISFCSRGLKGSAGYYSWVIHAGRNNGADVVLMRSFRPTGSSLVAGSIINRYNSKLASKSFRVGDEVFCWLRSGNAGTHYLISGSGEHQVCGYADREEAITRTVTDGTYGIPQVLSDPLDSDGATFTWARPFNTGQSYSHGGDVRIGDIDFLPEVSTARFGKCQYLSGSAVRAWDGVTLGDAGFQDFPVIASVTSTDVTPFDPSPFVAGAQHYYRVYAVRYNARGERFQSPGDISDTPVTIGTNGVRGYDTVTVVINTLPATNHSDVVFEVYRTEDTGTSFYLVGTIANDFDNPTVSFVDTMSDATLITKQADSHAPGVGALAELEESGPLGCAVLAVAGDRLWGAGGQVPAGTAQFSKLKEEGEGAGFDALAGFQTIDPEGHAVTSVAPLNDFVVVFERDRLHVISGTGPDNYGRGSFVVPVITLADGATTHFGTISTQSGVFYWGDGGPRLLSVSLQVMNVSQPVRALAETMEPTGVTGSLARQEVIWYTAEGKALLLNYQGETPRWAEWTGLYIAGCSSTALITTAGRLLIADPDAVGDDGQAFEFGWTTGNIRPEQVLQGCTILRAVGIVGQYKGRHKLRLRIYYDGSPMWTDEWVWIPTENTWLSSGNDFATLKPLEVDALKPIDRSGAYNTHKRVTQGNCKFFRVAVSNINTDHPTYVPYELSLELGQRGGLGRVPVNSFS